MIRKSLLFAALILALCCSTSAAQRVTFVGGSKHYTPGDFTEVNPTVLYTTRPFASIGSVKIAAKTGVARNSYDEASVVAGAEAAWRPNENWMFTVDAGGATGYGENPAIPSGPYGLVPMSTQGIHYGTKNYKYSLVHVPGAVAFGVTIDL